MLRTALLCLGLVLAGCTVSTSSSLSSDGLTQLQRQARFNIEEVGIRGADVSVLDTADLATINSIANERSSFSEKHARISHILDEAGAI